MEKILQTASHGVFLNQLPHRWPLPVWLRRLSLQYCPVTRGGPLERAIRDGSEKEWWSPPSKPHCVHQESHTSRKTLCQWASIAKAIMPTKSHELALSQHQYHQSTPNHFAISRSISSNFPLRKSVHFEIPRTPDPVDSVNCPSVASEMPPQRIGLPAPPSGCEFCF
jgi:hypothetical protein